MMAKTREAPSRPSFVLISGSVAARIGAGEARAAAFAGDDRRIIAGRTREAVHHGDRIVVVDRHEGIRDARQHAPGERRRLVAFEHRHHGRLAMRDLHRMAGSGGLEDAGGACRIDHHEGRALIAEHEREMAGDRGCHAADAGLHEHMGRRLRQAARSASRTIAV